MIHHALFSAPFRPFFWLGTFIAIFFPMYWVCILVNGYYFPDHFIDPLNWHAFEMLFGFSMAIIAGFILTASSSWTNTPMMTKGPLILLVFFWLLERIVFFIPDLSGNIIVLLQMPFFSFLLAHLYKKFINDKFKLFAFGGVLSLIFILKILFLIGVQQDIVDFIFYSKEMTIHLITLIIVMITGKIFPFFTNKACPEIKITSRPLLEKLSKLSIVALALSVLIPKGDFIQSILLLLTGVIHLMRWLNWSPLKTSKNFLLFSLHIGYGWLVLYFFIRGLGHFFDNLHAGAASLHVFTMGALGTLIMAMMARVSLGHTGRDLKAGKSLYWSIFLITLGTLMRVYFPAFNPEYYYMGLHWAMGTWTLGYIIFFIAYTPILWKPRPDGKC